MGFHYTRTLSEWRRRFYENTSAVKRIGFDDRFLRMWDFYLAWCEGAFWERYINVVQLVLAKNGAQRALMGDPAFLRPELSPV